MTMTREQMQAIAMANARKRQSMQERPLEDIEKAQRERIESIPEITGSMKRLSENIGFKDAVVAMTTFDPDEFGAILTEADPNIGVVTTPEGERIAVNNQTGEAFSINKIGPSLMDAVQIGGTIAAFTPAGRAQTLAGVTARSAATQAGIEAAQQQAGGEFDKEDVAIAAAAVPITAGLIKGASSAVQRLRGTSAIPPGGSWLFGSESASKAKIRKAIESGDDDVMAKYVIDGANKIKSNPAGRQALKQGVDEGIAGPISVASSADKAAVNRMLDVIEKGRKSKQFRTLNRPSDILGDTIVKRYDALKEVNKEAAKNLDRVANDLKGQTVNIDDALGTFFDDLETLGVSIGDDFDPIYSPLSIEEIGPAKNFIEKTLKRLKIAGDDAYNIHRLKKLIDEDVAFGKAGEGLTGNTERIVKILRRNLNKSLGNLSDEYKSVNTQFSDTIEAMNNFGKAAGTRFNPDSPNVSKQVGQRARLMLGRRQVRTDLIDSLYDLDKVAQKYGKTFDDSVGLQVSTVDELERLFPSFAPTSFEGQIERAVAKAGRAAADKNIIGIVIEAGAKAAEKTRGINEKNLIKSLRKLVEVK